MKHADFIKSALLAASAAVCVGMLSFPVMADETSGFVIQPQQEPIQMEEIQTETIQRDVAEERIQDQQVRPVTGELESRELETGRERGMSLPPTGPTSFDYDMTREQDAAASLAF